VAANRARADLAAKNAELAAEQAKVEARFELAQKAIALFHTGVSEDALLKNAEFKELRTRLLKEAAKFYADLEKLMAGQTDAKSGKTLAEGYFQLAELTGKIGDQAEAVRVHRQALAIRRELAAEPGADVETRLDVAISLWMLGYLQQRMGNAAEARAAHEEMRDIAERLEALVPTDPARFMPARAVSTLAAPGETLPTTDAVRAVLAHAQQDIGNVFGMEGKFPEALDSYRRALAIYQTLADANPARDLYQDMLAGTHQGIGIALALAGKPTEGIEAFRKASDIMQKLAYAKPSNTHV